MSDVNLLCMLPPRCHADLVLLLGKQIAVILKGSSLLMEQSSCEHKFPSVSNVTFIHCLYLYACQRSKLLLKYISNLDLKTISNGNVSSVGDAFCLPMSGPWENDWSVSVCLVLNLCFCQRRETSSLSTRHIYCSDTAVFLNMKHSNSGQQESAAARGLSFRAEVHQR